MWSQMIILLMIQKIKNKKNEMIGRIRNRFMLTEKKEVDKLR